MKSRINKVESCEPLPWTSLDYAGLGWGWGWGFLFGSQIQLSALPANSDHRGLCPHLMASLWVAGYFLLCSMTRVVAGESSSCPSPASTRTELCAKGLGAGVFWGSCVSLVPSVTFQNWFPFPERGSSSSLASVPPVSDAVTYKVAKSIRGQWLPQWIVIACILQCS